MRHQSNCRRRTTNAFVTVTVTDWLWRRDVVHSGELSQSVHLSCRSTVGLTTIVHVHEHRRKCVWDAKSKSWVCELAKWRASCCVLARCIWLDRYDPRCPQPAWQTTNQFVLTPILSVSSSWVDQIVTTLYYCPISRPLTVLLYLNGICCCPVTWYIIICCTITVVALEVAMNERARIIFHHDWLAVVPQLLWLLR